MHNILSRRGLLQSSIAMGTLLTAAVHAAEAPAVQSGQVARDSTRLKTGSTDKLHTGEPVMTVTAPDLKKIAGTRVSLSADDLQQRGSNDFGSVMRNQLMIGATGTSSGSSDGKSGYDRGGYTGYNIRGLESNRVALDVDGIPQPDATGRSYASRAGVNTFGIGRDYIDPYAYGQVNIVAGATDTTYANNALGGSVSFLPKSADDYLKPGKETYFGYQSDYDSASRSWHNGITAAAGDQVLRGLLVYSRRDGQQTRNNSDEHDAYPANWHSDALLGSAIWQPNDEHKVTGVLDFYNKVKHTHYDSWNSSGSSILGTANQQSNTRRWGASLKDEWTPSSQWLDSLTTKVFWQQTQAHDNTLMPNETSGSLERVYSDYDVKTYGMETQMATTLGRHNVSAGLNGRISDAERPFSQSPAPSVYSVVMKPQGDSRTTSLGGFVQDDIQFDLNGHAFSVIPGVRAVWQETKARNLDNLTANSTVLKGSAVENLYGKSNEDTQLLPSLSFNLDLTPSLMTYVQYRRGVQFPNASQLYGSWNLGSSYAGPAQYALIGNTDLDTETSNNLEWGLKGEAVKGVTFNTSVYYNTYKNFIAYTRYTRAANPEKFVNVPSNIYTTYQAENRDKAYIWGGEISSKVDFGTWFEAINGLSANVGVAYSKGQSKSSYSGDKYVDLESVAPLKAIVGVAWDDPAQRYGTAITATFVKGKRAEATNREKYTNTGTAITDSTSQYMRIGGYGLVDTTAWVRLSKNVKLSGGIYNLTDRKYRDYLSSRDLTESTAQDGYDNALAVMPGRTFQLGVNVDF